VWKCIANAIEIEKRCIMKKQKTTRKQKTTPESIDVSQSGVTAEERHRLIAEKAYLRAERRGFTPGAELQDWLEAEAEIETMHRNSVKGDPD
jgi:hypothetical protein